MDTTTTAEMTDDHLNGVNIKSNGIVMDYYDKMIMAPMVRVGTLPMRLLARQYGCDIAYSEELVDLKLAHTKRIVNDKLGTVDFVSKDNTITYRTCAADTHNVLQLGTASAVTALAAAQVVVNDVCAIDINMGCPKFFSIQGGMGAALLSKPDTIKDILTTLIRNLPLPVTCKIRLLADDNATIDLMKMIESTGVKAIAVHMRTIPERPRDPSHPDRLRNIMDNANFTVPIIANGDMYSYDDCKAIKEKTRANSVMVARGAIKNISMFRPGPEAPMEDVVKDYLRYALKTDNVFVNTKYVVTQIVQGNEVQKTIEGKGTIGAKNYDTLCKLWGLKEEYKHFLSVSNQTTVGDKPNKTPAATTTTKNTSATNNTTTTTTTATTTTTTTPTKRPLEEDNNIGGDITENDNNNNNNNTTSAMDEEEPCLKKYRTEEDG
ncbi:hypothetical protein SAMD00019534_123460, partial [Acytostelium subglobosum LB1]|uniref:hypothetical protein n=1 Tax=Acytostelium subglobosum LB1 TaxID=1410327 RepID=UPI000644A32E